MPSQEYLKSKRRVLFEKQEEETSFFNPPIHHKSEKERVQILQSLKSNFLTQNLEQQAVQTIIDSMEEVKFKSGDNIVTQGETGNEYYILKSGKCQVIINSKDQNVYKSKELLEGEGFGEVALLYNEKRTATVRALQDCKVWMLDGKIFRKIIIRSTK